MHHPPADHKSLKTSPRRRALTGFIAVILLIALIYPVGYLVIRLSSTYSSTWIGDPRPSYVVLLPKWRSLEYGRPLHRIYTPMFMLESLVTSSEIHPPQ